MSEKENSYSFNFYFFRENGFDLLPFSSSTNSFLCKSPLGNVKSNGSGSNSWLKKKSMSFCISSSTLSNIPSPLSINNQNRQNIIQSTGCNLSIVSPLNGQSLINHLVSRLLLQTFLKQPTSAVESLLLDKTTIDFNSSNQTTFNLEVQLQSL